MAFHTPNLIFRWCRRQLKTESRGWGNIYFMSSRIYCCGQCDAYCCNSTIHDSSAKIFICDSKRKCFSVWRKCKEHATTIICTPFLNSTSCLSSLHGNTEQHVVVDKCLIFKERDGVQSDRQEIKVDYSFSMHLHFYKHLEVECGCLSVKT